MRLILATVLLITLNSALGWSQSNIPTGAEERQAINKFLRENETPADRTVRRAKQFIELNHFNPEDPNTYPNDSEVKNLPPDDVYDEK